MIHFKKALPEPTLAIKVIRILREPGAKGNARPKRIPIRDDLRFHPQGRNRPQFIFPPNILPPSFLPPLRRLFRVVRVLGADGNTRPKRILIREGLCFHPQRRNRAALNSLLLAEPAFAAAVMFYIAVASFVPGVAHAQIEFLNIGVVKQVFGFALDRKSVV